MQRNKDNPNRVAIVEFRFPDIYESLKVSKFPFEISQAVLAFNKTEQYKFYSP
jgi:hypothetical protein